MTTLYHGTSKLFEEFRPQDTIGTGEGKSKFGWGTYLTSAYDTAVLYSGKGPGLTAPDHYIYTVEVLDPTKNPEKYFVLHKPVPNNIITLVEKELGAIPKKEEVITWGLDFRKTLEMMLFMQVHHGHKPKGKDQDGESQKLCAEWLYKNGILGLVWPHGGWPRKGTDKPIEKFHFAMFNGKDITIKKIERVEVEFIAKGNKQPDKFTCREKPNSERQLIMQY